MVDTAQNSYDEILYPGHSFAQSHPDRLATLARLFGMKPAPVECCRVLELGCGDGGNLIPMAFGLPESKFVGIDLAARAIAKGESMVEDLGLKNITLRQFDIMDLSSDFGQFDYIIAHGVYSWVPPAVRDKILAICKAILAPSGVAYVSYNTYPGGHLRELTREMMLFHIQQFADPKQRIDQARALVKFLAESQSESNFYGIFLKRQLDRIMKNPDESIYHDDLGEINSPVYFHQFIGHAMRHGLKYLAEADFFEMQDQAYPPHVSDMLRHLTDIIVKEQYLDFLKCRMFRQTLLCHEDVPHNRTLKPEHMAAFYVASCARPLSPEPDIRSNTVEEFRGVKGWGVQTNDPLAKAAISLLGEIWPQFLHFDDLLARARSHAGLDLNQDNGSRDQDALRLGEIILRTYAAGLTELHVRAPHFMLEASERPVASPLARLQIQHGDTVTNLCHAAIRMEDALGRHLLLLLDGTRDRPALLKERAALVESGVAPMQQDGEQTDELEKYLARLAKFALLVA